MKEVIEKEVIELLQERIAISKVSADNENYLINLSIGEAERMVALLKEPTKQPPASEFTKEVREEYGDCTKWPAYAVVNWAINRKLLEACDRLDRADEENRVQAERIQKLTVVCKGYEFENSRLNSTEFVQFARRKIKQVEEQAERIQELEASSDRETLSGKPWRDWECAAVMSALVLTGGNKKAAARLLQIGERSIYRLVHKYNIPIKAIRADARR